MLEYNSVELDDRLTFVEEAMGILAMDTRHMCTRVISIVKVQWHHRPAEKAAWEMKTQIWEQYPIKLSYKICLYFTFDG